MTLAHDERMESMLELYREPGEAEAFVASGERVITRDDLMAKLKEKITGSSHSRFGI